MFERILEDVEGYQTFYMKAEFKTQKCLRVDDFIEKLRDFMEVK
jgi:hypothetical protein